MKVVKLGDSALNVKHYHSHRKQKDGSYTVNFDKGGSWGYISGVSEKEICNMLDLLDDCRPSLQINGKTINPKMIIKYVICGKNFYVVQKTNDKNKIIRTGIDRETMMMLMHIYPVVGIDLQIGDKFHKRITGVTGKQIKKLSDTINENNNRPSLEVEGRTIRPEMIIKYQIYGDTCHVVQRINDNGETISTEIDMKAMMILAKLYPVAYDRKR